MSPKQMEPMYQEWEAKLSKLGPGGHINNPKVPRAFVTGSGAPIWKVDDLFAVTPSPHRR
jgi:hypothetical protein